MEPVIETILDVQIAEAFGINPEITLLPGGADLKTFRSGSIVLRYLGNDAQEAGNWNAELFDHIKEDRFRVAKPIKTKNGLWIVKGWVAEQFLEGRQATEDDLPSIINAVSKFHEALDGISLPNYRKQEHTVWDRADLWAWGEVPKEIDPKLHEIIYGLLNLRKPVDLTNQLIHGDLNLNNVLIADNQPPAIIDLAPYWRPVEFAYAVMAYWVGPYKGDLEILNNFKHIKEFEQMLIRAGLRMALTQKDPKNATGIKEYEKANKVIEEFVRGINS